MMQPNTFGATSYEVRPPQPSAFGSHMGPLTQMTGFANNDSQASQLPFGMQGAFGQPDAARPGPSYQMGFANFPVEQPSQDASNVQVNNLVDSGDGVVDMLHVNGTAIDHPGNGHLSEQISEYDDIEQTLGHANPYAALANGHPDEEEDEDEEEDAEDEEEEQHNVGHANSFAALANEEDEEEEEFYAGHQLGVYPGAAPNGEYDDDDEEDGDIEDEDGEEFDEDESDLDEDEDDEEADGDQFLDPRMLSQNKPNTNTGFATQATTDSEVIELSD